MKGVPDHHLYDDKSGRVDELSVNVAMLDGVPNQIPARLRQQELNQAGIVTRKQAMEAGLSADKIAWLLKQGAWRQVFRGTYATFTGSLNREAWLWAAVLYAGRGAYLSHRTAAKINRLTDDAPPVVDVTIPASRRVLAPEGVVIHLSCRRPMIWTPPGIPPYSIAEEAVLDLVQAAEDRDEVIALVTSGFNRRLLTEKHLMAVVQARRQLRWRHELHEIISLAAGGTHSPLEYRHDVNVQRAHGLPEPVKQAKFRKPDGTTGYRDRYYPQYGGLIIELDGKRFHSDGDRDRERDNHATVTGATLRYGWSDVTRRACET
ncbi:MAG: type IV toxin-antitoxin system AbiEi family antitoxin domain-containing protein, partial [Trebonia sp.]